MKRTDTLGDTVLLFPVFSFAFSAPLENETVEMAIAPDPGNGYHSWLNDCRDTAYLAVTGMLAGRTSYEITPAEALIPESGARISPGSVRFTFATVAGEQEPNGSAVNADMAPRVLCGIIRTANDTDWYQCAKPVSKVWRRSYDNEQCGLRITDSLGNVIEAPYTRARTDTLSIPDSLSAPVYVCIFSATGAAGLRYCLGTIHSTGNEE